MNKCIIGIGSNINADENIRKALDILNFDFHGSSVSKLVKTKPIGIQNQADFVNGAVKIETNLDKNELQTYLKKLEDLLGRDRTALKFGPRTIDLDIVIWNNKVVDDDYYERQFLEDACSQLGFQLEQSQLKHQR